MLGCDSGSQVWDRLKSETNGSGCAHSLQCFRQFRAESGLRSLFFAAALAPVITAVALRSPIRRSGFFALGRLCRVGPQQPVFQRCAIEAANDRLHLVCRGSFYKCEALGLLRFVIADDFDRIGYQVLRGEPRFDIVSSDPRG